MNNDEQNAAILHKDKILFLDIDGVVRINEQYNQTIITELASICAQTGAKIVITSDWRKADLKNKDDLLKDLIPLKPHIHEDWATEVVGHRHNEVARWLVKHPQVVKYVILEDFQTHFEGCSEEMHNHIVWCDTRFGLTTVGLRLVYHQLN